MTDPKTPATGCICRELGPLLTAPGTSGWDWRCDCGTVWPGARPPSSQPNDSGVGPDRCTCYGEMGCTHNDEEDSCRDHI